MVGPAVAVKCPACGTPVRALLAPAPATQWVTCPHCQSPVPMLLPRDPPPLYTWEVLPGLYPILGPPRVPRWRARRLAAGALFGVAIVAVILAGLFAFYAFAAPAPGNFQASGSVELERASGGAVPSAGVVVDVTTENGGHFETVTADDGSFVITGLATGGLTLQFSATGYSDVKVYAFVSTLYSSGATGLEVTMARGSANNVSTFALTPFTDLEQFVAAIGSGIALLGVVAAIAAYAALVTMRADRPAIGVVGGGAGLFTPLALALLSLGDPFPALLAGSAALALLGGFALSIRAVQMAQTGPAAT